MARKTIILLGQPVYNEDGVAGEVIKPGHLVDGVLTILKHASAGGACPRSFALERDEMGKGIDATPVTSSGSPDYAVGDTVKVGSFHQGQHVLAFIASGQNIQINERLESAGDGTLKAFGSGTIIGRSLEEVGAVTALTRIRVEIM